jgi:hypothetical protein
MLSVIVTEQLPEAVQKIIECAFDNHADLIMIPTRSIGNYRRLILGSTGAKILHDADCPGWTGVHLENALPSARAVVRVEKGEVSKVVPTWRDLLKADLLLSGRKADAGVLGRLE